MRIRGAPAIGVTAAYALALGASEYAGEDATGFRAHLEQVAAEVRATRPTAVNLFWAIARALAVADTAVAQGVPAAREALVALAERLRADDVALNREIGRYGADLVPNGASVLTHCNTGALATVELRHGARGDPGRGRGRQADPRLRGRDAAVPPGRPPDRLGAAAGRHPAHADHRQHGRALHGAWRGRPGRRRGGSDRGQRRCGEQDWNLQLAVLWRTRTAFRSTWRRRPRPST